VVHGPGWQFPQRQNKICGNTNNIRIKKKITPEPSSVPSQGKQVSEVNSELPKGKMSNSVTGDGILNEWAGQFHNCAMSWEALTQTSDLSLEKRTKRTCFTDRQRRQFYLQLHNKVGAKQKNRNSKLMPKAMAMIQRLAQNKSSVEFSTCTSHSEGHGFVS